MFRTTVGLLCMLLAAGAAVAQITIGPDDFPVPGVLATGHELFGVPVNVGSPGENQAYTVSNQDNWELWNWYIVDPASTPYGGMFPAATFCLMHDEIYDEYEYYRVTSTALTLEGTAEESEQDTSLMIPDAPMLLAPLPCTYGTSFPRVMHISVEMYPGMTMHMTDSTAVIVDGWGMMTTEFGSWPVLRFQEHHFSIVDTNGHVIDTQEEWQYSYRSQQAFQGVEIKDNPNGSNPNFTQGDLLVTVLSTMPARPARGPMATGFALLPNYPNPFNPVTILPVELDHAADVTVSVYDETGRLVTEQESNLGPGHHELKVDGSLWASGPYFVRATDGKHTLGAKIQLIK